MIRKKIVLINSMSIDVKFVNFLLLFCLFVAVDVIMTFRGEIRLTDLHLNDDVYRLIAVGFVSR